MVYIIKRKHIIQASEDPELEQSNNTFIYALEVSGIFECAGLTPIFLYDPAEKHLIVTSKERIGNKFH